jgi:hypothetical protein
MAGGNYLPCLIIFMSIPSSSLNAQETKSDRHIGPSLNAALRQELLDMGKADQDASNETLKELGKAGVTLDKETPFSKIWMIALTNGISDLRLRLQHTNRMKTIVDQYGWPGKSIAGSDGANAAWLLVQHSDLDCDFQKRCLKLMEQAPEGEVERQHIAYLMDRVLVSEGKKQRYGTQFGPEGMLRPIEDEGTVDVRRKDVGLPPLKEYIETTRRFYSSFPQSDPVAK